MDFLFVLIANSMILSTHDFEEPSARYLGDYNCESAGTLLQTAPIRHGGALGTSTTGNSSGSIDMADERPINNELIKFPLVI